MKRILLTVVILSISGITVAAEKSPGVKRIEGFRKLKWQTTATGAKSVYADLEFGWKSSGKSVIYRRTNEDLRIGETIFDEIRYSFKDDKFIKLIAILESISGSKMSDADDYERKSPTYNYRRLKKTLEAKYGLSTQYNEKAGRPPAGMSPLYRTRKKAEWLVGDSKIELSVMTRSTVTFLKKNKGKNKKTDSLSLRIEHVPTGNLGF
ncbi:MAG TPA: hypothetical protein DCO77_10720 [Nitrospiraceae bacterium]|nr:hypothetical protein [Nitrospiraceae bacterium]